MKKIKINSEFFELPQRKFVNKFKLSKFNFEPIELYDKSPCIYISPNVSRVDKLFVTKCISKKFVFLKQDIVSNINNNNFNENKQKELLDEIKNLAKNNISISLFFNSSPTIFGENEKITESLALFLYKTELDLKFLTFPGLFYDFPVWADEPRKTKIYTTQNVTIKHRMLIGFNKKEIVKTISGATPASASTYNSKQPVHLNSNKLACHLERVMYCCPVCEKLFSLYSEFSCIKCKNCGTAIEFSPDGNILFSNKISTFEGIENFQFNALTKKDFQINELITYKKITQILHRNCRKTIKIDIILQIYAEKIVITDSKKQNSQELFFENIDEINYYENNIIEIKTKNANQFYFYGKNNENLFILKDLLKINKN